MLLQIGYTGYGAWGITLLFKISIFSTFLFKNCDRKEKSLCSPLGLYAVCKRAFVIQ